MENEYELMIQSKDKKSDHASQGRVLGLKKL